jgi:hypothetical protein
MTAETTQVTKRTRRSKNARPMEETGKTIVPPAAGGGKDVPTTEVQSSEETTQVRRKRGRQAELLVGGLTVKDMAKVLGVTPTYVYKLVRDGDVPIKKENTPEENFLALARAALRRGQL